MSLGLGRRGRSAVTQGAPAGGDAPWQRQRRGEFDAGQGDALLGSNHHTTGCQQLLMNTKNRTLMTRSTNSNY
jgi:hypothetical protein